MIIWNTHSSMLSHVGMQRIIGENANESLLRSLDATATKAGAWAGDAGPCRLVLAGASLVGY